ncbi:MAG: glucosaminidase domain-containing protein, partial [Erysipelotrichaceae bacterium]|nr:glucosaminidase domain-containing protein [Erysipelotrichaceae bacterium]
MLKKTVLFTISFLLSCTLLFPMKTQKINAYEALASGYWVGMVSGPNKVTFVSQANSYDNGIALMKQQTSTETNVATLFKDSKIIASMYATLDFTTVGSSSVNSYMYAVFQNGTVSSSSDYFNGYYTAEGPYITTGSTENQAMTYISGLHSRVNRTRSSYTQYDIVPISVAKPLNYYVTNDAGDLKHYFAYFSSQSSLTIGRAPEFMKPNIKYYSADGHYFYESYTQMIDDLNANVTTHAINPDAPWFNYYQFLPFHSSTNYTASDFDYYFRAKGYDTLLYTYYNKALNGQGTYPLANESLLYSAGSYFMQMQQIYGINPLLLLSISVNESSWGRSYIAAVKNNLFGMAAYDSSTGSATSYDSVLDSILDAARVLTSNYFNASSNYNFYYGSFLGNKEAGVNVKYASDAYWGEKAAAHYYAIDKYLGLKDYNHYVIGVTNKETVRAYTNASTSKTAYILNGVSRKLKNNAVIIIGESGDFYQVMSDCSLSSANKWQSNDFTTEYDFENNYAYIKKSDLTVINPHAYNSPKNSEEINSIRIEYLNEYIPVKVNQDAPLYYDAYKQATAGVTVKKDAYLVAIERAYSSKEDVMYKVLYNGKGTPGWIRASDVTEITGSYAIKYNETHDAIGAAVYKDASTSSTKVGEIKYNKQTIPIIQTKNVNSQTWYYICLDASTNLYGWTLASGYGSPITHTAAEKPNPDPEPIEPEDPDDSLLEYRSGMYYLDQIQLNDEKNAIILRGLLAIEGMDNKATTPLKFVLRLTNQFDQSVIEIPLDRWTNKDEYPYDVNTIPGVKYDYSGAWFTQTIDFSDIPDGDYSLTLYTKGDKYYTSQVLSNNYSINIAQRFVNKNNTGIELRTNYLLRSLPLELFVRKDGLLSSKAKPTMDNAFVEYTKLSLQDQYLSIRGTGFNITGDYQPSANIQRSIVLENIVSFERFEYDVGSITNGDYKVTLRVDD